MEDSELLVPELELLELGLVDLVASVDFAAFSGSLSKMLSEIDLSLSDSQSLLVRRSVTLGVKSSTSSSAPDTLCFLVLVAGLPGLPFLSKDWEPGCFCLLGLSLVLEGL